MLEAVHLFPGLRIRCDSEVFFAPEGLASLLPIVSSGDERYAPSHFEPFSLRTIIEDVELNVALHECDARGRPTEWRSWANGKPTEYHGSHVAGLKDALRGFDWQPAYGLVHVVMHDVLYAGPSRERLDVPHVREVIREGLPPLLSEYVASRH